MSYEHGAPLGENDLLDHDVPLAAIRIDGGTQARTAIDAATVAEYAEALKTGAVLPPLSLFFDGVHFWLADGFHRYHAYLQAGIERISAEIRTGSRRDAVLYAVGANTAHGLRRTNADKRRAVQMVLAEPEWAAWSDREIARVCGVTHPFVAEQRQAILKRLPDSPAEVRQAICTNNADSLADTSKQPAPPATRTVTRNGTTYQQKVKAKPAPAIEPQPPVSNEFVAEGCAQFSAADSAPAELAQLRSENAALREQLGELAEQFEDTLAEAEAMRKVIEADDQLAEAVRMLRQAQELNRVLETRLLGLTNEKNEVLRRYKGAARELDKIRSAHAA